MTGIARLSSFCDSSKIKIAQQKVLASSSRRRNLPLHRQEVTEVNGHQRPWDRHGRGALPQGHFEHHVAEHLGKSKKTFQIAQYSKGKFRLVCRSSGTKVYGNGKGRYENRYRRPFFLIKRSKSHRPATRKGCPWNHRPYQQSGPICNSPTSPDVRIDQECVA